MGAVGASEAGFILRSRGRMVRGQLPGLRGRPLSPAGPGRRPAAPHQVQAAGAEVAPDATLALGGTMRRREIFAYFGALAMAAPAARAQQAGRTYRLGVLVPLPRADPSHLGVGEGPKAMGFVEGTDHLLGDLRHPLPPQPAARR